MTLALRYGARSDIGLRRDGNEDAMYAGPRLLAIADGMGGQAAGEVASRVAIETVAALDQDLPGGDVLTALRDAVETANDHLRQMIAADSALEGMGTTLTALLWAGARLGLVHVGDSRAYLFRDGNLQQITHDHTFVQSLVDEGRITAEEATTHPQRSWITRALDGRGEVELDLSVREARAGDRYLLCSDGLSGVITDQTLCETLAASDPQEACDRLVELALRAGGPDNISCIVADVVDDESGAEDRPIVGGAAAGRDDAPAPADDTPAARAALTRRRRKVDHEAPVNATPPRSRAGRRLLIAVTAVAGLLAVAVVAGRAYLRTQYYVGVASSRSDTVAVYRGVSGSVLGVDLAHVASDTDLPLQALPDYQRDRVRDGIPAANREQAQRIVANLRQEACPLPTPTAGHNSRTPSPSPSPLPSYCRDAA